MVLVEKMEKILVIYLSEDNAVTQSLTEDSDIFCQIINQVKKGLIGDLYNAAPENGSLQSALSDLGAKHTQNSYRI